MLQDLRYAVRALRRTPGFAATAILTMALGIGATTAIFSVVNSLLLEPLPYAESERLVRLITSIPTANGETRRIPLALNSSERDELVRRTNTLDHVAAAGLGLVNWVGREPRMQAARLTASVFPMLGARPLHGRLLTPADEKPGATGAIVLSYRAWRRAFAGNAQVLGDTMVLESALGRPVRATYTIVGIMPETFEFPSPLVEFWVSFMPAETAGGPPVRTPMIARLADGVPLEVAAAELLPVARELRARQPGQAPTSVTYELVREQAELIGRAKPALVVFTIAVVFVLLIACVNVANLLLARTASRERELAIRTALGAGRRVVLRLLLTESLVIALVGGTAGTLLAVGGVALLRRLATTPFRVDLGVEGTDAFPRVGAIHIDGTVLLFSLATAVVVGLLVGLAPLVRQFRVPPMPMLRIGAGNTAGAVRGRAGIGLRNGLVIAQVSLAMVLLVGGALLARSFVRLVTVDPGYEPDRVVTFQTFLPSERYPAARAKRFAELLTTHVSTLPGVTKAAYANQLPLVALSDTAGGLWRTADAARLPAPGGPDARLVSRGYFEVMGIQVVAGRPFCEPDDANGARVLLVNETLARQEFGGTAAVGQQVYVGRDISPWTIIGIAADVRQFRLDRAPGPQFFVDARQWPENGVLFPLGAYYAVRIDRDRPETLASIQRIVRELEPEAVVFNVAPMTQLVSATLAKPRLYAVLLGIFAAVGVAIAVVGIYGVISFAVAQRTREIGIRMALGASRRLVLMMILRHGLLLAAGGMLAGLAGATALTGYLESMLFGVTPLDATTFAIVGVVFTAAATGASLIPARRATGVDPLVALRAE